MRKNSLAILLVLTCLIFAACGGGGSSSGTATPPVTPPTIPPPVQGQQKTTEAILTGFKLSPSVESFATGFATISAFDVSGHLSGDVLLAGIDPVAVDIVLAGAVVTTLNRSAGDPARWNVASNTIVNTAALQALLAGDLEVIVRTTAFPNGEIGGRMLPDDVTLLPDNGSITDRSPRDEIIYFVMTDRFFNGDPANDQGGAPGTISSGGFNPASTASWHGGDFTGLSSKLDYLQGLGITAIWVTPPVANRAVQSGSDGYHGYWGVDFENVDPHLGTNDEFRAFVDAAHARGIKVYQDIVVNHTGDVITYAEGQFSYRPLSEAPYTPVVPSEFVDAKNPAWLNDPQYYHNRGNTTFSGGEDSIYGDFVGLDDIATEQPFVRQQLIDIYQGWVEDFGVDGFRLDTAPHVKMDFWSEFAPALIEFASTLGKDNLTLFGEAFNGDPAFISDFITRGKLPSVLNFPLHFTLADSFSGAGTNRLAELFASDDRFIDADSDARDLVNFFGNHDIGRSGQIMRQTLPGLDDATQVQVLQLAYAMTYFLRGVPTIYYGDEQGFVSDGGDQGAREDMMASTVSSYNNNDLIGTTATTATDNFDQTHPLYRAFSRFAEVYKQHDALRNGIQLERFSRSGAGLYLVSRIIPDEEMEYVVAFNTAASSDTVTITTNTPDATWYSVWPPGQAPIASAGDGVLELSVPAYDFSIFRSDTAIADPAPVMSLDFPELTDGQRVDGTIELRTDLMTDDLLRVWFETSVDGGPFELAGADYTAPFRIFWDSTAINNPAEVTLRASVMNPAGDTVSTTVNVLVDNRVLSAISAQYENGNNRSELAIITGNGEYLGPLSVSGNDVVMVDPDVAAGSLTLIYQDRTDNEFSFDRPVFIDDAILSTLAVDDGNGNLVVELFINNNQQVANSSNFIGIGNPPTLPTDIAAPPPFADTELFVRGSFNDWSLDNSLAYIGNHTYHAVTEMAAGSVSYKIADSDWSSSTDLGSPYTQTGLSVGAGTANLADTVETSPQNFYFFSTPDGNGGVINFHQLIPVNPVSADNPYGVPIYLRGSFNDWGLSQSMSFDEATATLSTALTLDPGAHRFKIASEDWSTADFGGDTPDDPVTPALPKTLVSSSNNLFLSLDTANSYQFEVDVSAPDTPVLTVTQSP